LENITLGEIQIQEDVNFMFLRFPIDNLKSFKFSLSHWSEHLKNKGGGYRSDFLQKSWKSRFGGIF